MKSNENYELTQVLLQVVDNQLNTLNPPETSETYTRLISEGYSRRQARDFIAAAVKIEIDEMMKHLEPFNRERFVTILRGLPNFPALGNAV